MRYCTLPTRRKVAADLDRDPLLVSVTLPHPSKSDAALMCTAAAAPVATAEATPPKPPSRKKRAYDAVVSLSLDDGEALRRFARQRAEDKEQPDTSYLELVLSMRDVDDFVRQAWSIQRAGLPPTQRPNAAALVQNAASQNCKCGGSYLTAVYRTLARNHIDADMFRRNLQRTLVNGAEKGGNFFIIGPSNCGKSLVLHGLNGVQGMRVFPTPAHNSKSA